MTDAPELDIADLEILLEDTNARVQADADWGVPAHYIPELAKVDPHQFAIMVCTAGGKTVSAGSANTPFSIQSISKVFALIASLGRIGDQLWTRVGREPAGGYFEHHPVTQQPFKRGSVAAGQEERALSDKAFPVRPGGTKAV